MIRLAVRCAPAVAELVLAELLELAPGGVEEDAGEGWVEYAIYGAEGELPDLGGLRAELGGSALSVRAERVPDDWGDRWRDFHRPAVIAGGRVVIRPSWEASSAAAGTLDVVVEPGQAFGTGAHPTTRMCVELLLELADAGEAKGPIADLGTGSGVLAIVAAKLGWEPVTAVDSERAALAAAAENAAANGVRLALERADLRSKALPAAPTVVANLTAPLLGEVAAALPADVERVVCSGLLEREADAVARAFTERGLVECRRRASGEWGALLLGRDPGRTPG